MVALDTDCARCRTASTVANARPVGLAETVAYGSKWNVMILSTTIRVSYLIVQSENKKEKKRKKKKKKAARSEYHFIIDKNVFFIYFRIKKKSYN